MWDGRATDVRNYLMFYVDLCNRTMYMYKKMKKSIYVQWHVIDDK